MFDSLADDHGASFEFVDAVTRRVMALLTWYMRWLFHFIADYYGLTSCSVTVGDRTRREVYVCIQDMMASLEKTELPRPLWP